MSFTISLTLDRIAAVEWEVDAELLGFRQHAGDRRRALGYCGGSGFLDSGIS
jgi:hypothetical protein